MNQNLAKLIAVGLVAGVAKALFGPAPVTRSFDVQTAPKKDLEIVKDHS